MEAGIQGTRRITVTKEMSAKAMGSGELQVFSTPSMIALVEETAWKSVSPSLERGQGTVGTLVNVRHLSATPIGMDVHCETTLTEVDGRRLVFSVRVTDEIGLIGEGTHERYIISNGDFQNRADAKKLG